MTREAQEGAAQQQIGHKRKQNRDHRRLTRIERGQHLPLVDDIHDHAKKQDSRGRDDSLPQAPAPPLLIADAMDQGPDKWPAPEAGVVDSVARCRMKRKVIGPPGRSRMSLQRRSRLSKEIPYQATAAMRSATRITTATRAVRIAFFDGASVKARTFLKRCGRHCERRSAFCNRDRAHVDRNRLRLLWIVADRSRVKAAFGLTGGPEA
jgi:hypothetical protein